MPQSENFGLLKTVANYDAAIQGIGEIAAINEDDIPHLDTSNPEVAKKNEKYAKLFKAEMQDVTMLQRGLHWKWAQIFFYFDYGRLWATKEIGEYNSFNDWLTDYLEELPFGRAQINKLKRIWLVYIYRVRCNENPDLLQLLLSVGNVDKLSEMSAIISKANVSDWLTWLVAEKPTLQEVHLVAQETKRRLQQGESRARITSGSIDIPLITQSTLIEEDEEEPYTPPQLDIRIEPSPPRTQERYSSLKATGIGKSWFGKLPPETPVIVERVDYPDRTEITIYKDEE